MASSYIVDRMLAEFAAAAVVFAKAVYNPLGEDKSNGKGEDEISFSMFLERIEGILQGSYPHVFPYFSRCLNSGHKHFIWTGPQVQILPRSEDIVSVISLATMGELLDLPRHQIYTMDLVLTPPATIALVGKRHDRGDSMDLVDEQQKKRKC